MFESTKSVALGLSVGLAALGGLTGGAGQPVPSVYAACAWNVVTSPNQGTGDNALLAVAGVSASSAWAVGYFKNPTTKQTLVEHWNGSAWKVIPSPNVGTGDNVLQGVAAVSGSNIWAVGYDLNSGAGQTLIENWNGHAWSVVTSPNLGTGSLLFGVRAFSSTNVWAVGYAATSSGVQTLIEHFDGVSWTISPSANVGFSNNFLYGISGSSPTDLWAVGEYRNGSVDQTLTEHWNGSMWTAAPGPNVGPNENLLRSVFAVAPKNVWAVGDYVAPSPTFVEQTLIEHWNGTAWSVVGSPNNGTPDRNHLYGVTGTSNLSVTAVGDWFAPFAGSNIEQTEIQQWNGSHWAIVTSPNAGTNTSNYLRGVAVASKQTGLLWAVGYWQNGGTLNTLTEKSC